MRKIINGRKYDTDTAKEICSTNVRNLSKADFNYLCFTLFLKKTGEFFIEKETYNDLEIYLESDIENLEIHDSRGFLVCDAKDFIAEFGSVEQYEELFGEVSE